MLDPLTTGGIVHLSRDTFNNIPLVLDKLKNRVIKLEHARVDFVADDLMRVLHEEHVFLAAESLGGDVALPPTLPSNNTVWLLTGTQSNGWRLAVPEGESFKHTIMRFMLVPVCMSVHRLTAVLEAFSGTLPYLEITVDGPLEKDRELRGLYITAMACSRGYCPKTSSPTTLAPCTVGRGCGLYRYNPLRYSVFQDTIILNENTYVPIIKSAIKRMHQAAARRVRNMTTKRDLKAAVKAFLADPTAANLSKAQSNLDKAVKKNVLEKNTAARRKAKLAAVAKAAGTKTTAKKAGVVKTAKPAAKAAAKKAPAKKPAAKKPTTKKA